MGALYFFNQYERERRREKRERERVEIESERLQKVGTAMGVPPAPPWATIFFGIHEETVLTQFGDKLQLYR